MNNYIYSTFIAVLSLVVLTSCSSVPVISRGATIDTAPIEDSTSVLFTGFAVNKALAQAKHQSLKDVVVQISLYTGTDISLDTTSTLLVRDLNETYSISSMIDSNFHGYVDSIDIETWSVTQLDNGESQVVLKARIPTDVLQRIKVDSAQRSQLKKEIANKQYSGSSEYTLKPGQNERYGSQIALKLAYLDAYSSYITQNSSSVSSNLVSQNGNIKDVRSITGSSSIPPHKTVFEDVSQSRRTFSAQVRVVFLSDVEPSD